MNSVLEQRIEELHAVLEALRQECGDSVEQAVALLLRCYQNGGGVFLFGNGGSAADAQHIAGELNGRFLAERRPLKAQSLAGDASTMTCIANDYGYEQIFARQLRANAAAGDVAWALSTSGNSPNAVEALKTARSLGLGTLALTGQGGGKCADYADVLIAVPSGFTPHIQEASMLVYHVICEKLDQYLSGNHQVKV